MSFALFRLALSSQRRLARFKNLGPLYGCTSKRYIQDFQDIRFNNTRLPTHFVVLPEVINTQNNEVLRIPKVGEDEIDFSKIDLKTAYKGLSHAIIEYENFIADIENDTIEIPKTVEQIFNMIGKHIYRLDCARNIVLTAISLDQKNLSHEELFKCLKRYEAARRKRLSGRFDKAFKEITAKVQNLDQSDKKLLTSYRNQVYWSKFGRPLDDNTIDELRGNLRMYCDEFRQRYSQANSLFSTTIDDPEILAALTLPDSDVTDLNHKQRTPFVVGVGTYKSFMQLCPDRFIRRRLWEVYNRRCSPKAAPTLNTTKVQAAIRSTRRKLADQTGYRNHQDLKLSETMAKSKESVLRCIQEINKRNVPMLKDRMQELTDFANDNKFEDQAGLGLREWDIQYYSAMFTRDILIGVDPRTSESYFPLQSVIRGIGDYFRKYLNIEMIKSQKNGLEVFTLKRDGYHFGDIIHDHFEAGKRPYLGIRGSVIRLRVPGNKDIMPTAIATNGYRVNPTSGVAQLKASNAVQLFDCFIKASQKLLYNFKYYELNATSAQEKDCINLLPYICKAHLLSDHRILQSMSNRGQAGQDKPIDSDLTKRLMRAFYYFKPVFVWRDLYLAHLDAELYSTVTATKDLAFELYEHYSPFERSKDDYDYCSMIDLFVGPNDGLKYTELWAKQLATTCLEQVKNPDGTLPDDAKMVEFYRNIMDIIFDPINLDMKSKLTTLFPAEGIFEPGQSGLGVL